MPTRRALAFVCCILLSMAGCGGIPNYGTINPAVPTSDAGQISRVVQATFAAMTAQPVSHATSAIPSAAATLSGATGSLTGTLSYAADSLPPMYVTAFQVGTQSYRYVITKAGQTSFEIDDLPAGKYHVVAYTIGGGGFPAGLAGGFTKAVTCGLTASCTDHSLVDVEVKPAQTATGVNPVDWYAPIDTFPAFPQQAAATTAVPPAAGSTSPAETPPGAANGSIAGNLMFPASGIPGLRIVAFAVGSRAYFYTETTPGSTSYQIDGLPPGTYHVVAYSLAGNGFAAGITGAYSQAVACGLQAGCDDHSLIDVAVTPGNITTGIGPNDYYAPAGTIPADPVP